MQQTQCCPYCDHEMEDCYSNWSTDTEDVTCDACKRTYQAVAVYEFQGFQVEKLCRACHQPSDDGDFYCDCIDPERPVSIWNDIFRVTYHISDPSFPMSRPTTLIEEHIAGSLKKAIRHALAAHKTHGHAAVNFYAGDGTWLHKIMY